MKRGEGKGVKGAGPGQIIRGIQDISTRKVGSSACLYDVPRVMWMSFGRLHLLA